jgi:hypothetical protein
MPGRRTDCGTEGTLMRIKQWRTAAGLVGIVAATAVALGAAPASADPATVHSVHGNCTGSGGLWSDYGLGEHIRYGCHYRYPSYTLSFFYLASGEFTQAIRVSNNNGGYDGNYHTP